MTAPVTITIGQQFGRGSVVDPDVGRDLNRTRLVRLMCDPRFGGCGTTYEARISSLRNGNTKSCGCLGRDMRLASIQTHGLCSHPLYKTWRGMKERCENPDHPGYPHYGGRDPAITVYGPWHDAARFIADVESEIGPRPGGTTPGGRPLWTLNRKDNDGNYGPGNIEWADWASQRRNQGRPGLTATQAADRRRRVLEMLAAGRTRRETADALDITYGTVCGIIRGAGARR